MKNGTIEKDLNYILNSSSIWSELKDKSIFLTGGTGFFGIWFLKSFLHINKRLLLNANITILSRKPNVFLKKYPEFIVCKDLTFIHGDIENFEFPKELFDYIIHAATTNAEETFNNIDSLKSFNIIANGTKRILDFAVASKVKKVLLISSGSVYGKSMQEDGKCLESDISHIDIHSLKNSSSYGKIISEFYASYYANKYSIEIKIARCFTFVGPYLQLNIHYAIGNFISEAIKNKKIIIKGDGKPERTYMYSSDLMIWLWTILINGKSIYPYNVGSEHIINMEQLAILVAKSLSDKIQINILSKENTSTNYAVNKYIPSTIRAKKELNLKEGVSLEEAISKTIEFYKDKI